MTEKVTHQTIHDTVHTALAEDVGNGDITAALIPAESSATAEVICREQAVICGVDWFNDVFQQLDTAIHIDWQVDDGDAVQSGQCLCRLQGPARSILTGERTALNFLQTLSATATLARRYADAVNGTGTRVLDTRKTLPGLRAAQKYAVACGGCYNHRKGLFDAILIKENHILAAGSITTAVQQAKALTQTSQPVMIEVEVENLVELEEALNAGVHRLLLDNMDIPALRQAVDLTGGRAELEASGGITLENIRAVAETGVDYISIGDITKNIKAVDLSMRFNP